MSVMMANRKGPDVSTAYSKGKEIIDAVWQLYFPSVEISADQKYPSRRVLEENAKLGEESYLRAIKAHIENAAAAAGTSFP